MIILRFDNGKQNLKYLSMPILLKFGYVNKEDPECILCADLGRRNPWNPGIEPLQGCPRALNN